MGIPMEFHQQSMPPPFGMQQQPLFQGAATGSPTYVYGPNGELVLKEQASYY